MNSRDQPLRHHFIDDYCNLVRRSLWFRRRLMTGRNTTLGGGNAPGVGVPDRSYKGRGKGTRIRLGEDTSEDPGEDSSTSLEKCFTPPENPERREAKVAFGKYRGLKFSEFAKVASESYLKWMRSTSLKDDTCEGMKGLLNYMKEVTTAASGGDALADVKQ